MTIGELLDIASRLGVVSFIFLVLVAAMWSGRKRIWVFGHHYEEALQREQAALERETEWRNIVISMQGTSEHMLEQILSAMHQHSDRQG